MGCQPSNVKRVGPEIKVSIIDSSFMKNQNEHIRKQMQEENIVFEYFISQECFLQEFSRRYSNRVVMNVESYQFLKQKLERLGVKPHIYIVLDGKVLDSYQTSNIVKVQSYKELIKYLRQNACPSIIPNSFSAIKTKKRKINIKILSKNQIRSSEQIIFEATMKKSNITYQFYSSFQLLQESIIESQSQFVISDYIFHRAVVDLFSSTKVKVFCYCSFDKSQSYHPDVYSLSNNYLDVTTDIKQQLKSQFKNFVKCTKVYLYSNGLDDQDQIKNVLQQFDIQVKEFNNIENVIKQTTFFFCVTVLCSETQTKSLAKFFQRNDCLDRVKILGIPKNTELTVKGLYKLIRNIKKGYKVKKSITNSVDIIDKHYNSTKFQQIKKELQNNDIKCFGYGSIGEYTKNKKFISPFIICNWQQKLLLLKYMKQLQCKAKIIVFCNKNKINHQLKDNKNYAFVSSHFGMIVKFVKKTHVFLPAIDKQDQILFKQKIDKIKSKNRRISALKWGRIDQTQIAQQNWANFQFLNIAKDTNTGSIRDIQKTIATIWRVDSSINQFQIFKKQFTGSLSELRKLHKINVQQLQYNQMIEKIKSATISQLIEKVKTFFDADNELGLQINKSLMKTQSLQKKQITSMRQFLILVFLNYYSGYYIPRLGQTKLVHWISNSLIQKCEIGSYLFAKHFLIFYEQNLPNFNNMNQIGKYKIQLNLQYNSLTESQIMLNSFISYKDKFIFSPFSQFQIQNIVDAGQFKIINIKHIKNVDFLKYIYQDNILSQNQTITEFTDNIQLNKTTLVDEHIRETVNTNICRIKALTMFQKGVVTQAIEIHKKLIKQIEQKQNLDSVLVNQLSFQLACFYFKAQKNKQAGATIKQLLQTDPGQFIKSECDKIVKQVVDLEKQTDLVQQSQKRRVSQQTMKAFLWLNNKDENQQQQSIKSENGEDIVILENQLKCMQIDDIEPIQEFSSHKIIEKENILINQ